MVEKPITCIIKTAFSENSVVWASSGVSVKTAGMPGAVVKINVAMPGSESDMKFRKSLPF
jgi:hypothetical protein